jgi:hypothetical protein
VDEWLEDMLTQILNDGFLPAAYFQQLDCDAVLGARDKSNGFESRWAALFQEVEIRWPHSNITEIQRKLAEDIRREAFLKVSRVTGQHEIASYVSDDLDLVIRAKLVGMQDKLLVELWTSYQRGEFPTL